MNLTIEDLSILLIAVSALLGVLGLLYALARGQQPRTEETVLELSTQFARAIDALERVAERTTGTDLDDQAVRIAERVGQVLIDMIELEAGPIDTEDPPPATPVG